MFGPFPDSHPIHLGTFERLAKEAEVRAAL